MAATGGKTNSKDDDSAILEAMLLYWVAASGAYMVVFVIFRRRYPEIVTFYTSEWASKEEKVPIDVPQTMFGWVKPTAQISKMKDLWRIIGLDQAMALKFPDLCLLISLFVACPMVIITCPFNYFYGERNDDLDFLSQLGTANLGRQRNSPLWWVHAVIVWIVVIIVCRVISNAEASFVEKRFEWLRSQKEPRAITLMVENIPVEYQSDAKLREIFSETLSEDDVKSAHTVKQTRALKKLIAESERMAQKRKKATFKNSRGENGDRELVEEHTGDTHDAETYWAEKEKELEKEIQAERRRVLQEAEEEGDVNTSSATLASLGSKKRVNTSTGFVTFRSQSSAAAAYSARVTSRTDEFVMSFPPSPRHVHYDNLAKDPARQELFTVLGYVAIFFVFFFFLTAITSIVQFSNWLQEIEALAWAHGILQAVAGPLVYQTVVGFLPTIFRLIFQTFWVCPSEPYVQELMYRWYFWFLYVFVLFMSIIGSNPVTTASDLAEDPATIPTVIADQLPKFTNFYISLIILQVSTHVLNMVRHMQVIKYLVFRPVFGEKEAKKMVEPEDQDFNGIGSRSARWINTMILGLVFCQIQPLLLVYTAVHFVVCKFVYGHLFVFAEDRKGDVGGGIFQDQLWHMQLGLATYIILMTGYLMNRSHYSYIPGTSVPISPWIISFLSFIWLVRSACSMRHIDCEVLPRREAPKQAQLDNHDATMSYIQPELFDQQRKGDEDDSRGVSSGDLEDSGEADDDCESP
jgi:hypothetical protein